MSSFRRKLAIAAAVAFALVPASARAQWYSSYPQQAPAYPYGTQQPYAVEVAPGTYVFHHPDAQRGSPYVRCVKDCGEHARRHRAERDAPDEARPRPHADPALIEELRRRSHAKRTVVNTTRVVRDPPVVIVHKRVVDDPPRVIVRRHIVEEPPVPSRREAAAEPELADKGARLGDKRTIRADAEVMILGPDRMTIRLFRKRRGAEADARAQ